MGRSKIWILSGSLAAVATLAVPAQAQQTKNIRFVLDWAFQGQQAPSRSRSMTGRLRAIISMSLSTAASARATR